VRETFTSKSLQLRLSDSLKGVEGIPLAPFAFMPRFYQTYREVSQDNPAAIPFMDIAFLMVVVV
jgi:hypothetical protein